MWGSSGHARGRMLRAAATLPVAVALLFAAPVAESAGCKTHHGARYCRAVELRKAVKTLRAREADERTRLALPAGGRRESLSWRVGYLYRSARWHRAHLSALRQLGTSNVALARYLAARRGWVGPQWEALRRLWTRETSPSFPSRAPNGQGCDGIPQACPASKMGPGWEDSPTQQIEWGLDYIAGTYGSPLSAWYADDARSPHWY